MKRRCLPIRKWPKPDRELFGLAFDGPNDPFEDRTTGKHLSPASISAIRNAYGRWLGWLQHHELQRLTWSPDRRIDRTILSQFKAHLEETCNSVSVSIYFANLYNALRYMQPDMQWGWLREIVSRLQASAKPNPRPAMAIDSVMLANVGDQMFADALTALRGATGLDRRQLRSTCELARDGLLLTFLTFYPLRRTSLSKLCLNETLHKVEGCWQIALPAEYLKNNRSQFVSLPARLSHQIDEFVQEVRSRFPGANQHSNLWPSWLARGLNGDALYNIVKRRLRAQFGLNLTLHDMRRVAATSIALFDPDNVLVASDLLGHTDFRVTGAHYIKGKGVEASRVMTTVVEQLRQRQADSKKSLKLTASSNS